MYSYQLYFVRFSLEMYFICMNYIPFVNSVYPVRFTALGMYLTLSSILCSVVLYGRGVTVCIWLCQVYAVRKLSACICKQIYFFMYLTESRVCEPLKSVFDWAIAYRQTFSNLFLIERRSPVSASLWNLFLIERRTRIGKSFQINVFFCSVVLYGRGVTACIFKTKL